mgnify:CR=1 FL=1
MLSKTKGIVLSFIKFKETSIISKIFTEKFGLQSYIINRVRVKNSKFQISSFQPLSLLDLVVYTNKKNKLGRLNEVNFDHIYLTNHQDQKKISICLFLSEILLKMINFQNYDPSTFIFMRKSLLEFDNMKKNYENFHLQFLIKFSKFLGFEVTDISNFSNFQLQKKGMIEFLNQIIISDYSSHIKTTSLIRNKALEIIIDYFREKTEMRINLHSISVLNKIFV